VHTVCDCMCVYVCVCGGGGHIMCVYVVAQHACVQVS